MKRLISLALSIMLLLAVSAPALALEMLNENYWTEAEAQACGLSSFTDEENYALQSGDDAVYLFGLKDAKGNTLYPATLVEAEPLIGTDYLIVYDKQNYSFLTNSGMPTLMHKNGEIIGTFADISYNADDGLMVVWHLYEKDDKFHEFYYICDKNLDIIFERENTRIERTEPNTYLVRGEGLYVPGKGFVSEEPLYYHLMENLYMTAERDIVTGDGTLLLSCGDETLKYEYSQELMDWQIWLGGEEYRLSDLLAAIPTDPATGGVIFSDVLSSDYFFTPVLWAVGENITAGTSATTFSPHATCTRAQILTFLWRAAGQPQATIANPFADISSTDYYYGAALWAAEKGMVSGESFLPATPCTRGESITYIWKAADKPAATTLSGFTDIAAATETAQAADWAREAAVTAGTTATTFAPDATCTRAQIITFLYRAFAQ